MNSSESFAPLIVRLLQGSGLMLMHSDMGLVCRLMVSVTFGGLTSTVFDLRRVVENCC